MAALHYNALAAADATEFARDRRFVRIIFPLVRRMKPNIYPPQFGEERVGDPGNDRPQVPAASGGQGAALSIGQIIGISDYLPYSFGHFGVYSGEVIDGTRDSGHGNIGKTRHNMDMHVRWCPCRAMTGFWAAVRHRNSEKCVYRPFKREGT